MFCFIVGAQTTYNFSQECTHVVIEELMPVREDLLDAIVAKKACVLSSWIEVNKCFCLVIAYLAYNYSINYKDEVFVWNSFQNNIVEIEIYLKTVP